MNHYNKLLPITILSLIIMYAVMFLNVDKYDDIFLSLTRLYMSVLMVSPMSILMILFMKQMYSDTKKNGRIIAGSILVFIAALYCLRTQAFISDDQYMKAMIPHHSSAVMTSKHASLENSRVQILADSIIKSQEREINLMKAYLITK